MTPIDPDHIETETEVGHRAPREEPGGGPVPEDNQPGHHPEHEQDKPDLDAFAEKFGTARHGDADDIEPPPDQGGGEGGARESAAAAGRSLAEDAVRTAGTAAGVVEKVAKPAFGMARSVLSSAWRHRPGRPSEGASAPSSGTGAGSSDRERADADRLARLESRVADIERRLEGRDGGS